MNFGLENRNKTIAASALGVCALGAIIYAYQALFGGGPPPAAPASTTTAPKPAATTRAAEQTQGPAITAAPGVAAVRMASTSASLDPTLDESAMLRTESLIYAGSGRNIFSATYVPPVVAVKTDIPPPRPVVQQPLPPTGPIGPPPPPPINLKFFGTAVRAGGARQAFLLAGEDVYLASQGDIVARKYRIVSIGPNSVQVEDLVNSNTQTLPLQN